MKEITDWLGERFPQVRVSGDHTGMHFVLKCPGRDIGPNIKAYGLISKNNYSVSGHFNDAVIIGIGEAKTEEIIATLSHFLTDVYK